MISPIGRRRNRNRAGYTLIELILLAIIIAVLVAVATPLFRNTFSSLELKEVSYNIAKLINYIQEKSILEGVPYKLTLDTEKARYYLTKMDPKEKGEYVRLEGRLGRIFVLPQGMTLKSDKKEVYFYPDGHSDKAAITLTGKGKSLGLAVKGSLGYVEIAESAK